jgi:hypothetical protein
LLQQKWYKETLLGSVLVRAEGQRTITLEDDRRRGNLVIRVVRGVLLIPTFDSRDQ